MRTSRKYDVVIVGGGFYGCMIALSVKEKTNSVLIIEQEDELLKRASYCNQARIHNGYHYPRAFMTAIRSHTNFSKFVHDFRECIYNDFDHYYAIAADSSKTTSSQFIRFCQQIGVPLTSVSEKVNRLFNNVLIENVFKVKEYVFNAAKLRKRIEIDLRRADVDILFSKKVVKIKKKDNGILCHLDSEERVEAKKVFNCAYSGINELLKTSNLSVLPFKHELIEMPILHLPDELKHIAVTIMDGPYFGFLPFPDKKAHSLWHVRYAVIDSWIDEINKKKLDGTSKQSSYLFMKNDIQRYLPILREAKYLESLYEIKTVLTQTENNDGRPILYRPNWGIKNHNVVMGGKIDNIYDIIHELKVNPDD